MKTFDITTTVKCAAYSELDEAQRRAVDAAREANRRSYSPYSHFAVGAAIELDNGELVTGANQENVAYPSGTCAERTACFYAGARHPGVGFTRIAISARGTDGKEVTAPVAPCGACRQALLEYETLSGHLVEVLLVGADDIYILPSVASTLPLCFDSF